ncbi:MAG: hypothetical protein OEX02_02850 [Cyclobacteriaceae bacterium]|nr:hypothetical protein [Cyclobacteriaceae bacterium]
MKNKEKVIDLSGVKVMADNDIAFLIDICSTFGKELNEFELGFNSAVRNGDLTLMNALIHKVYPGLELFRAGILIKEIQVLEALINRSEIEGSSKDYHLERINRYCREGIQVLDTFLGTIIKE